MSIGFTFHGTESVVMQLEVGVSNISLSLAGRRPFLGSISPLLRTPDVPPEHICGAVKPHLSIVALANPVCSNSVLQFEHAYST